ncbi:YdcH family protein [Aquabacterium sp.]|uniref:YdcH family protein n=1 Tax=Aquabacterium sp. TaxID=1872578 RepID=UPI002E349127|nr:DUF465 domain-containing protein [Aquabacterium sp.]HEX5311791.1 DUF465 domain-containing protein [Aquabacterium sp.]
MVQDHHPLAKDFPELKDKIHTLKTTNAHFAKLERDYEELDKAIVRLETGIEHGSSAELEQKKLQRVSMKDELYSMLKA